VRVKRHDILSIYSSLPSFIVSGSFISTLQLISVVSITKVKLGTLSIYPELNIASAQSSISSYLFIHPSVALRLNSALQIANATPPATFSRYSRLPAKKLQ